MNSISKTDWARIDAMSDDEIDISDIPPLTNEFFSNAKLRKSRQQHTELPRVCIDNAGTEKRSDSHHLSP
jgi:hypothetical protein